MPGSVARGTFCIKQTRFVFKGLILEAQMWIFGQTIMNTLNHTNGLGLITELFKFPTGRPYRNGRLCCPSAVPIAGMLKKRLFENELNSLHRNVGNHLPTMQHHIPEE